MKNVLSFLIGSKLYSGQLTEDRICNILDSQGFKIIEFVSEKNEIINTEQPGMFDNPDILNLHLPVMGFLNCHR